MNRALTLLAAATMFVIPASGRACGACVEDKVAATYDHAVVMMQALGPVAESFVQPMLDGEAQTEIDGAAEGAK